MMNLQGWNDYPNPDNFPVLSFPQEVPAPDVEPDEGDLILVAYSIYWIPVLMAACDQLRQFSTWQGDDDTKLLAFNRATNLKDILQTPLEIDDNVPAPYWDTDEDVDDEEPLATQEWYGMVTNPSAPANELTFVENAVIWIFTGFIALVLAPALPVGVAAGLTFRTLATRFTLAFRRGDIIEQIRIVIDAKDYGTVNTGDVALDGVIEVNVDGLDTADFHDILLVVTNP